MSQSPLLERLRQAIEAATDEETRATRLAERAACWARHGEFQLAESEIASLRTVYGDGRSGRVSIMIMCAEAQLIYYKNLGEQARDRMMRAQLLSVAGRDGPLTALTSAWLAHISFNLHRHGELVRCAKTCLSTVTSDDHEAVCRLALTLGDAFLAAEQSEVGAQWYTKAHEQALKLGDHATIGALTYNRAAMGTFMARVEAARSSVDATRAARLAGEVRTAMNYQAIAQLQSLQALLDYSLASVHVLQSRYAEAVPILAKLVDQNESTSPLDRAAVLRCDLALCLAHSGQQKEAEAVARSIPVRSLTSCTADDQVVALAALNDALQLCGSEGDRSEIASKLGEAMKEHSEAVASLRRDLADFDDISVIQRL